MERESPKSFVKHINHMLRVGKI